MIRNKKIKQYWLRMLTGGTIKILGGIISVSSCEGLYKHNQRVMFL